MAVNASGYVLRVPEGRRAILLKAEPEAAARGYAVAEPVPLFEHSKRAPLVVFASFQANAITHLMDGRKGASAGTGLVRLNLVRWLEFPSPIQFAALVAEVPARYRVHLERTLSRGGILPPKTLRAVVDTLIRLAPESADRLARFSEVRRTRIADLQPNARTNLAMQKEALTASLAIAGIDREEVLNWTPTGEEMFSFLDGLPAAEVREDTMLIVDHAVVPGFNLGGSTHVASKVFVRPSDGARLTVVMANRTALEEQTGADLIYYNERFKAFVFVQYKAMRKETKGHAFRWKDDPADDLVKEIARMKVLLIQLDKLGDDGTKEGFRLHTNPFFLKLCPKIVLNPDDKGLFTGMYIPLDYWTRFDQDKCSSGPKGGKYATYENVGRKLNNSEFIPLVAGAWIGSTIPQSAFLSSLVREVLSKGRTVALAIESPGPEPDDGALGVHVDWSDYVDDDKEVDEEPPLLA